MAAKINDTTNVDIDESTELTIRSDDYEAAALEAARKVSGLTSGVLSVGSTFTEDNFEARKAIYTATNDAEKVSDHLDETFALKHVVVQSLDIADEETGVISPVVRTILIADDGRAYAAISEQLYSSVQGIIAILGEPASWPEPVNVQVVEKRSSKGRRFFSISLV